MKTLKNISKVLALVAVAVVVYALLPSSAQAQATGNVAVEVRINAALKLWYYDKLIIQVSANELAQAVFGTTQGATNLGSSAVLNSWTDNANIAATVPGGTNTGTQVVQNVWAVKAVGNPHNPNVRVSVALTANTTLTNNAGVAYGTLAITSVQTRLNSGGAFAASVDLSPSPGNPIQNGDIQLGLDLTNTAYAGTYVHATGQPQFTITATNI